MRTEMLSHTLLTKKRKTIKKRKKEGGKKEALKERGERKIILSFTIYTFYPNEKMTIYQEGR